MERPTLTAQRRTTKGTRAVKHFRAEGMIPGIVYGKAMEPLPVVVSRRDLVKLLHSQAGKRSPITLRLADGAESHPEPSKGKARAWEKPVLVQMIQHDPVQGGILHIDFHAIVLTERLRIKVPVVLKGEPVGVKQDGGILEHFLREIEVECLPTEIPQQIEFEVGGLKIGDAIHVRDLLPPSGVKITSDLEGVIASVLAPKEEKPEEVAAEVTEPEVIRERKPEAEEEAAEEKEEKPKAEKAEAKEEKREK